MSDICIRPMTETLTDAELCDLYSAVGWTIYAENPTRLRAAIDGSHFVATARLEGALVGLVRVVSDGVSIAYIQDILVHPVHHRRGIGRRLLAAAIEHYPQVRQKVLLTDDRQDQLNFYASMGFSNTRELVRTPLNAFVRIEGVTLG